MDVDFDVTERLLIKLLRILIILEIKLNFNWELHLFLTDFNKTSDSVKKKAFLILLHSLFLISGILVGLIKFIQCNL